jgi:hypothetical protein
MAAEELGGLLGPLHEDEEYHNNAGTDLQAQEVEAVRLEVAQYFTQNP